MKRSRIFVFFAALLALLSGGTGSPLHSLSIKIVITQRIHFDPKSDRLKEKEQEIDQVAEILGKNPEIQKVKVEGHADAFEAKKDAVGLSVRRAQAVFDRLVKMGVSPGRLSVVGYGDTCPVADNSKQEGRRANRRVEFNIAAWDEEE